MRALSYRQLAFREDCHFLDLYIQHSSRDEYKIFPGTDPRSAGLCEIASPSPELLEKYNDMKGVFYQRLLTAYGKVQAVMAPIVEKVGDSERGQVANDYIKELQTKPEFQAFIKIATALSQEAGPLADNARSLVLGVYEQYLRPHIGEHLSRGIDHIKTHLDVVLPTQ